MTSESSAADSQSPRGTFTGTGNFKRGGAAQGAGRRGGFGGGMVSGQVLSIDATSMTVSLPEGGSKIVILSKETKATHSTETTVSSIKVGDSVSIFGMPNQDGSVTAQRIETGTITRFGRTGSDTTK
jgi:hypothetical protein